MDINSKVLAVLEGGYNLDVTADCAVHTVRTLTGEVLKDFNLESVNECGFAAVTTTVNKHKEFWEVLNDNKYKELERKFAVLIFNNFRVKQEISLQEVIYIRLQ